MSTHHHPHLAPQAIVVAPLHKLPDLLLYFSVVQLRRRRWTRCQINDMPPDLVIETDPNNLLRVRRYWLRSKIEALERHPDWIWHRAAVDAWVSRRRKTCPLATTPQNTAHT